MIQSFSWVNPTEILFGRGVISQLGETAARFGKKALLVTGKSFAAGAAYGPAIAALKEAGVEFAHFDSVTANPTTETVTAAANLAKSFGAQVIIGIGGGSSMDCAKAVAVEASHPGTAWDYLHYKTPPTEATLPMIAVSTTSGTGSQVTPCAVLTNTAKKDKSAIWHRNIYPRVAIVDPELICSTPKNVTAATGFDAFAHNFEAFLSVGGNPYTDALALEGIRIIFQALPKALADGQNLEAREQMAWADTLGGLAIASAGVTLPHGVGMQVGGHCPHVSHGLSLAVQYPEFTRYTLPSAPEKFAAAAIAMNPSLRGLSTQDAAQKCCEEIDGFLKKIGMWTSLKALGVSREEVREIADCGQVLGDYKNNPRVATLEEMYSLLMAGYDREAAE